MKPAAPIFALLALAPALLAQTTPQTQLEKAAIEGTVVKAGSGEPVRKARLVLQKVESRRSLEPPPGAVSDVEGHFVIPDIEPGQYRLWVERNGFVRQEYGQRTPSATRPGTPFTLEAGQRLRDVTFRLVPTAVIAGRVLDEDSEPVPNVRVQALRNGYMQGQRRLTQTSATATNDLGEYRLHGLAPGRYYISTTYIPGVSSMVVTGTSTSTRFSGSPPDEIYAPAYYPGTTDPSSASQVEAAAGGELRGVDIRLQVVRMVTVRGRALLSTGRPAQATVRLVRREAAVFEYGGDEIARLRPRGFFEIHRVRPGPYFLLAEYGEENRRYATTVSLDVGSSGIENLELVLTPGFDVSGRLRVEGDAQIAFGRLTVSLQARDPNPMGGAGSQVKPDGSFLIQGVARMFYQLAVFGAPEDVYLKSAQLGDQEVLEAGLDLTQAEAAAGVLDLVLSPAAARIQGMVRDAKDQPAAGAQVVLAPESRRRNQLQLYKTAVSDQSGRFTLRGIPPGEYKLFAWEDIEPDSYQDPELLRQFESRAETCKIQPGDAQNVQLKLIPAEETAGR